MNHLLLQKRIKLRLGMSHKLNQNHCPAQTLWNFDRRPLGPVWPMQVMAFQNSEVTLQYKTPLEVVLRVKYVLRMMMEAVVSRCTSTEVFTSKIPITKLN